MKKLTIQEFAVAVPESSGIGERNTVSNGVDVDPNSHANDLLASHFANCKRHGTTQQAVDNALGATGSAINIGGHGDSGFLETGGGQGGPWPDGMCIYLYNEIAWGPDLERVKPAAVTTLSIWSCHVGAEQDGADLLFAMAKRCVHTVRAGTGFLYSNAEKTWWQPGSVWQVATPTNKPAPIAKPPLTNIMANQVLVFLFCGMPVAVDQVEEVSIEPIARGVQKASKGIFLVGDSARNIAKSLFISAPMDFVGVGVHGIATATIKLRTKSGATASFSVFNGGLAIDFQSNTGYYLAFDPLTDAHQS